MRLDRSQLGTFLAGCAFALVALAAPAGAIQVTEFPLPVPQSSPLGIAAGPDGNMWFVEVSGSRFGRVTPAGAVTDFSTGSGISTNARPWGIAAGPDGNLWFTEEMGNRIGRLTPATASAVELTAGISPGAGLRGIAGGPDGNVWFTEDAGRIGRITPAGTVTEFSVGITAGSRPLGIATGRDGNLWFTEQADRVGRITPTGTVTEFTAGITAGGLPSGITAGPDGNVWFTEFTGHRIGRITPAGVVTEFALTAGAQPRSIVAGPDGNLWFTEEGGNRLGRITPAGAVTEYPVTLAGGGRPVEIAAGPGRDLWFTTGAGNHIARARLDPAVTTGGSSAITTSAADPGRVGRSLLLVHQPRLRVRTHDGLRVGHGVDGSSRRAPPRRRSPSPSADSNRGPSTTTAWSRAAPRGRASAPIAPSPPPALPVAGRRPLPGDRTGPRVRVASGSLILTRAGRTVVSLRCPLVETLGCRGTVRLETAQAVRRGRRAGDTAAGAAARLRPLPDRRRPDAGGHDRGLATGPGARAPPRSAARPGRRDGLRRVEKSPDRARTASPGGRPPRERGLRARRRWRAGRGGSTVIERARDAPDRSAGHLG